MPISHSSSVSSDVPTSGQTLGHFVKQLASSLRELNSSVLLMTQYMVDGIVTDDLRAALEATLLQSHSEAHVEDTFVVVADAAPSSSPAPVTSTPATSSPMRPSSPVSTSEVADAVEVPPLAPRVHVPPERRWYAIPVGRNPGVFEGAHHVMPNIERIPGGYAVKCDDAAHARTVFDEQLMQHKVKRVTFIVHEEPISFQEWHSNDT